MFGLVVCKALDDIRNAFDVFPDGDKAHENIDKSNTENNDQKNGDQLGLRED